MSESWDGTERRKPDTKIAAVIDNLATKVEELSVEVSGLRSAVTRVEAKRKRNLLWLIPVALLALYSVVTQQAYNRITDRQQKQSLALSVGVCAMQNTIRIEFGNFLAEAVNEGIFDIPSNPEVSQKRRDFLAEGRARFALVPCEALVAGEDVRIELRYPSTVPLTTTTTVPPAT